MAEAISPAGIAQVAWDGRLDAERNYLYYAALTDRYRRQHQWLIAAVAAASFLCRIQLRHGTSCQPWTSAALAMLAALLALALITIDPSMKSAKAESAKQHFKSISDEWKYLWWHQYDPDAEVEGPNARSANDVGSRGSRGDRRQAERPVSRPGYCIG